jgi:phage-related protein
MLAFTLNHTLSSRALGLRLAAPVDIPVASRVVDDIEVAGRAGTLTRLGGWNDTTLTLQLAVPIGDGLDAYRRAAAALMDATTISLSGEPGLFRRVKHTTVGPLTRELASWGMFEAELVCQPFTYLDTGLTPVTLTGSGTVTNPGLIEAAPVITIHGTGQLTLTVNGAQYRINSPAGQVTLDADRLVAHVAGYVQTDALTGGFPTLKPGVNHLALGTGITKAVIVPNWRNP